MTTIQTAANQPTDELEYRELDGDAEDLPVRTRTVLGTRRRCSR